MVKKCILVLLIFSLFVLTGVSALKVVSTTAVLWDPAQFIGGDKVEVIYVADPTICPHMQSDIIPNRIQMQKDFIRSADLFIAHNGSVDKTYVMPYVEEFMAANGYGNVRWTTLKNPSMTWNTPDGAKALSREVAGWIIAADPSNRSYYESRLDEYLARIDAVEITPAERNLIAGQDAVVMVWQEDAAKNWLSLDIVSIFGPEFYMGGKFTPVKIVDDINANTSKYRNVRYVIENMQSGELAKGIEEALIAKGIPVKRVIFTNFPKSIAGVETLPDVLRYNKELVKPLEKSEGKTAAPEVTTQEGGRTTATKTPLGAFALVPLALGAAVFFARRRCA
ncbi:MAG TPA: metal ABC transporter substrate-binding protein [Methanolinea sp.]|nr:metal ABC transporter substrate-binding protein [Methanolinea sp.]